MVSVDITSFGNFTTALHETTEFCDRNIHRTYKVWLWSSRVINSLEALMFFCVLVRACVNKNWFVVVMSALMCAAATFALTYLLGPSSIAL